MQRLTCRILGWAVAIAFSFLLSSGPAVVADTVRTQTVTLQKGWNAVFLQVYPTNSDPAQVFAQLPVSIVATYFAKHTAVQFISDPAKTSWKKEGWGVWYAPQRADAFLSTLYAILGNRAYLVYAERDYVWNITGQVLFEPVQWQSDSFNLVGFTLDTASPPTFQKFYSGSPAHQPLTIFRLLNSRWTQVFDTVTTPMKDGEACWVYCAGGSDYQGPLGIKTLLANCLEFGDSTSTLDLTMRNDGTVPMDISLFAPSNPALPLAYQVRQVVSGGMNLLTVDLPPKLDLVGQDPRSVNALRLTLRRENMTVHRLTGLLKVVSDCGTIFWVPVAGNRADLITAP